MVDMISKRLQNHKNLANAMKYSKKLFSSLVKGLVNNETINTERVFTLVFTFN